MLTLFPTVACMQFTIALGDIAANCMQVASRLDQLDPGPGTLVVLPEMWATGFDYGRVVEFGEQTPAILDRLRQMAVRHQIFLAGSLTELAENGLPLNVLSLIGPEGIVGRQPKQHLFSYWEEDQYFQAGDVMPPMQTPFGPVAGAVCYDLRFPETIRRQIFMGSGVLVVSAQWPSSRLDHWQALLRARAIENQCYVVATNSCGITGKMEMAGHSVILSPDGRVLREAGIAEETIVCALDVQAVNILRERFYPAGERPWLTKDREKVLTLSNLMLELEAIRRYRSRVVFTNGCFDLLHAGHVSYLEQARKAGDCLVVGLNSDQSVRSLGKGPGRPINTQADRARVLAALGCVDYVVVFDEATPRELIAALRPDVLVKGADWPEEQIVGAAEVKASGGKVVRIVFEHDRSTTALVHKIRREPSQIPSPTTSNHMPEEANMTTIQIRGMKCQHCAASATQALEALGLERIQIDLIKGEATFDGAAGLEAIRSALAAKGFELLH